MSSIVLPLRVDGVGTVVVEGAVLPVVEVEVDDKQVGTKTYLTLSFIQRSGTPERKSRCCRTRQSDDNNESQNLKPAEASFLSPDALFAPLKRSEAGTVALFSIRNARGKNQINHWLADSSPSLPPNFQKVPPEELEIDNVKMLER